MNAPPTIHASAVLTGARAVLIRGPAGSGKSRLALNLLQAASRGQLNFARLVADDRVHVEAAHDRLIARPPAVLAGLLEVRGLGIAQLPYEPMAIVSWVVDLDAAAPMRLPDDAAAHAVVAGVRIRRLAVAPGCDPLPMVLAAVTSPLRQFGDTPRSTDVGL
ncbi:MAG TPA: HPr kinase/phosphatase C-terminal domain-containing protein [Xanthobacteraceae bacterium]|nr:HPr kinase/phosphatase C-terminal domain-containing protein [Xanthobacteraceae bacterium]